MIKIFVLTALVYVSGEGWTKGEKVHSLLEPQTFNTYVGCKAKRAKAKKTFKENKEYIKDNFKVTAIRLKCKKVKIKA